MVIVGFYFSPNLLSGTTYLIRRVLDLIPGTTHVPLRPPGARSEHHQAWPPTKNQTNRKEFAFHPHAAFGTGCPAPGLLGLGVQHWWLTALPWLVATDVKTA